MGSAQVSFLAVIFTFAIDPHHFVASGISGFPELTICIFSVSPEVVVAMTAKSLLNFGIFETCSIPLEEDHWCFCF
jgi:hypothetical protein